MSAYRRCSYCGFLMWRGIGMHFKGPTGKNPCPGSVRLHPKWLRVMYAGANQ